MARTHSHHAALRCIWVCLLVVLLSGLDLPAGATTSTLSIGGAQIEVSGEPGEFQVSQAELLQWVRSAAESVTAYYGRYPVPHVYIRIGSFAGRGVRSGRTFGDNGGRIIIRVGSDTTPAELSADWTLTHEMVHLSFPSMDDNHHWIEEGIAVYVEPIARIRTGHWTAPQMWAEFLRDMPQGLPQAGDQGLDHAHTWESTYWGGALFCFLADVEIRRQTHNRKGLEDALRGILNAGGDIREDWDLDKAFKIGDKATGTTALTTLYGKMKDRPMQIDLPALWKQLGVESDGATVHLIANAPLAAVRHAITQGETAATH